MDDFEHRVHVDSGRVRYPGQEAITRLRAEVEALRSLVEVLAQHDSYSTEYDGRMIALCPDCGGQDGTHTTGCVFVRAKAHIDAAPAAPQQADAVAWMAFGGSIVHAVTRNAMDPIEAERFDVPLYLHPPAAEVQQADTCPTCGSDCNERDELEKAEREIERLRSAPARPEDMAAFAAGLKADHAKTQAFFKAAGILTERGELMPEYGGPQQAEPVEIVPRVWREALRKLTFMARTSGGTPGPDEGLQTACAEAETLLSKPYNYPPAAPQQAEPVAQIGWSDEFGNLFPMSAWKPAQRTHHDSHKTAWRPVFLHPPAAEVTPIGPREPDMAMVICPTCTSQFRAIPVEVQSEVQRLRDALTDAIVEVESWGNYAPDYFQTKHNLAGTLDRLRRALEGE